MDSYHVVVSKMGSSFLLLYNNLNRCLRVSHEESVLFASCLLDHCNSAPSLAFMSDIVLLIKLCNLGQRPGLCPVQTQILGKLSSNNFQWVSVDILGQMLLQNT